MRDDRHPEGCADLRAGNGARVGYLRVTFQCTSDTAQIYLAVNKSTFELLGFSDRQPIARLDFVRDAHTVPAAHWNIHAERGRVSRLLGRKPRPSRRPLRAALPGRRCPDAPMP